MERDRCKKGPNYRTQPRLSATDMNERGRSHLPVMAGDRERLFLQRNEREQLTFVRSFGAADGRTDKVAGAPSFIRRESLQPLTAAARSLARSLG